MRNILQPFYLLVVAWAGWLNRHQQAVIDYLMHENRVLKDQLEGRRLRFTDAQRRPVKTFGCVEVSGCALNSFRAPRMTRADERRSNSVNKDATTISGQPDWKNQTPPAARNTDRLDAMSLREHSKTELMLISSARYRHRSHKHKPLAARPARLNALMTSYDGSTG